LKRKASKPENPGKIIAGAARAADEIRDELDRLRGRSPDVQTVATLGGILERVEVILERLGGTISDPRDRLAFLEARIANHEHLLSHFPASVAVLTEIATCDDPAASAMARAVLKTGAAQLSNIDSESGRKMKGIVDRAMQELAMV
jgi:hypothetical protein